MKCLHHTDADGKCAAYWVSDYYNDKNPEDFIMIDYGMDIDWLSKIEENEKVFIVDFSLEPDDMRKLLQKTKDVTWIDHHITAIQKYNDFETEIPGLRYNGIAGCVLTYCYLYCMGCGKKEFDSETMPLKAPWATTYIGDHDVWEYKYGKDTAHFKLGLDAYSDKLNPTNSIWDDLNDNIDLVNELIDDGLVIEQYRDAIGTRARDMYGFEYDFEGHTALCLNNVFGGSEWFTDAIHNYDLVCAFLLMKDGKWEYSLYSEKIDVSKIAKKYGGGGHPGASGFVTDELIFKQ